MKRPLTALLVLLCAQLALLAALLWQRTAPDAVPAEPLLTVNAAAVTALSISDETGASTQLARSDDNWLLPALDGLPADAQRVERLLAALTATDTRWPIAHTADAQRRFEVADNLYRRRIVLEDDAGVLATVYLGTAPALRKVHVRNAAQQGIYSIALDSFEVPGTAGEWLDPRLLQLRAPVAINSAGYSLTLADEHWRSASGGMDVAREAEALVGALRNLRITGVAEAALSNSATPALELQVSDLSGEVTLALYAADERYFVRSSRHTQLFTLNGYEYHRLIDSDAALLARDMAGP